jgi:hypothetical protein
MIMDPPGELWGSFELGPRTSPSSPFTPDGQNSKLPFFEGWRVLALINRLICQEKGSFKLGQSTSPSSPFTPDGQNSKLPKRGAWEVRPSFAIWILFFPKATPSSTSPSSPLPRRQKLKAPLFSGNTGKNHCLKLPFSVRKLGKTTVYSSQNRNLDVIDDEK